MLNSHVVAKVGLSLPLLKLLKENLRPFCADRLQTSCLSCSIRKKKPDIPGTAQLLKYVKDKSVEWSLRII